MKLVTFDEGRTGRVDGDTVVELDCGSTREYFERGGHAAETGKRLPLASVRLRAPIVPKKFFHTERGQREREQLGRGHPDTGGRGGPLVGTHRDQHPPGRRAPHADHGQPDQRDDDQQQHAEDDPG